MLKNCCGVDRLNGLVNCPEPKKSNVSVQTRVQLVNGRTMLVEVRTR